MVWVSNIFECAEKWEFSQLKILCFCFNLSRRFLKSLIESNAMTFMVKCWFKEALRDWESEEDVWIAKRAFWSSSKICYCLSPLQQSELVLQWCKTLWVAAKGHLTATATRDRSKFALAALQRCGTRYSTTTTRKSLFYWVLTLISSLSYMDEQGLVPRLLKPTSPRRKAKKKR